MGHVYRVFEYGIFEKFEYVLVLSFFVTIAIITMSSLVERVVRKIRERRSNG